MKKGLDFVLVRLHPAIYTGADASKEALAGGCIVTTRLWDALHALQHISSIGSQSISGL